MTIKIHNPNGVDQSSLPEIMVFSNVVGGGDGICYAMAEDGHVLGSHYCSNQGYAYYDLGVFEGYREDRHENYREHYPSGYQMRFVPWDAVKTNEKLKAAFKLNQELSIEAKELEQPQEPHEKAE